jgi:hypothetical protein
MGRNMNLLRQTSEGFWQEPAYFEALSKSQSITCHKGIQGEDRYTCTLSLTPTLDVEWVVNATLRPNYSRERDPLPIVQEIGWAPGPVGTGEENLATNVIRSPGCPARNE